MAKSGTKVKDETSHAGICICKMMLNDVREIQSQVSGLVKVNTDLSKNRTLIF